MITTPPHWHRLLRPTHLPPHIPSDSDLNLRVQSSLPCEEGENISPVPLQLITIHQAIYVNICMPATRPISRESSVPGRPGLIVSPMRG